MNDEIFSKALNLSYFYLKFRPRTEKEVFNYLLKKSEKFDLNEEVIKAAIVQLKEENLVNDKDFVSWFVEQRSRAKPKSRFALTTELLRFGIEKDLIDEYFNENEIKEDDLAFQALSRRWQQWNNLPHLKRLQKATSFLSRRGFSFEIIKRTINKIAIAGNEMKE